MDVKIKLFATLREGRGKIIDKVVSENTTPKDIFNELNIDLKDVAILLLNGLDTKPDTLLKDGDTLSVFPPVGGG